MSPAKVKRELVQKLTDLPNVGVATAKDLLPIGIKTPPQLVGKDLLTLYLQLCRRVVSGKTHVYWMCSYQSRAS